MTSLKIPLESSPKIIAYLLNNVEAGIDAVSSITYAMQYV